MRQVMSVQFNLVRSLCRLLHSLAFGYNRHVAPMMVHSLSIAQPPRCTLDIPVDCARDVGADWSHMGQCALFQCPDIRGQIVVMDGA